MAHRRHERGISLDVISSPEYTQDVIRSFRCKDTRAVSEGFGGGRFRNIERSARKRLRFLEAAVTLSDLAGIPGNHLEALSGDRRGQHSIRVNDQYRICFVWKDGAAWD